MASLDSQPDTTYPIPVENCIQYEFEFDDHVIDIGAEAIFTLAIDAVGSNGVTTMTLLGITFTGNGSGIRSWAETVGDSDVVRAAAMKAMIRANPEFINTNIITSSGGGTTTLSIEWNEPGLQQNFTFANVDVVNIVIGSTNGNSSQFDLNKKFWWELIDVQGNTLSSRNFITVAGNTFLSNIFKLDIRSEVSPHLRTDFPTFDDFAGTGKIQLSAEYIGVFDVRYGVVDLNGCDVHYGEIKYGEPIRVFDGAFNQIEGIVPWWSYSLWGNTVIPALTDEQRPIQPICNGTHEWRWYILDGPASGVKKWDLYDLIVVASDIDGNVVDTYSTGNQSLPDGFGPWKEMAMVPVGQMNASPYIRANAAGDVASWNIQVKVTDTDDDSFFFPIDEDFKLFKCNCDDTEVYFKEPKCGFKTIMLEKKTENLTVTGNFIKQVIDCDAPYSTGGNTVVGKSAVTTFLSTQKKMHKNSYDLVHLINMLKSEEIYRKIVTGEGQEQLQSIYIIPGSYSLYAEDGLVTVEFEWGAHDEVKIVSNGGL